MQKHIQQMTELCNELATIGSSLDEEDHVAHLLTSVPEIYNSLVTALETSEKVPWMQIVIDYYSTGKRNQANSLEILQLIKMKL